jgi:hypothetical protein
LGDVYKKSTLATRYRALLAMARVGRDHAVIAEALASEDAALLIGAVRAAGAGAPEKHRAALERLAEDPFVGAYTESGLSAARSLRSGLEEALRRARAASEGGGAPATQPRKEKRR